MRFRIEQDRTFFLCLTMQNEDQFLTLFDDTALEFYSWCGINMIPPRCLVKSLLNKNFRHRY